MGQECRHVDVVGLAKDVRRRSDLPDAALENHGDAIRHRHRFGLIVGNEDEGTPRRRCSSVNSERICALRLASRLASGSSIRKILGWRTMARPKPRAGAGRRTAHPVCDPAKADFECGGGSPNVVFDLGANPPCPGKKRPMRGSLWANERRSNSERCGKVSVRGQVGIEGIVLKHIATPRLRGGSWSTGSPSIRIMPFSALVRPAIRRNRVDFPQPEGPSSVRNSPSATLSSTP